MEKIEHFKYRSIYDLFYWWPPVNKCYHNYEPIHFQNVNLLLKNRTKHLQNQENKQST